MRILSVIIIIASLVVVGFASPNKMSDKKQPVGVKGSYAPVAVLELFTSEGCSSCPPADNLLPQLMNLDSNVIALSFHVDYWNRLGWSDPFSKSSFSERQREYASQLNLESVYTPQLVVNGKYELIGSSRNNAELAIKKALKENARVKLVIDKVMQDMDKISFTVAAEGTNNKTKLLAALVQKKASVNIKAGENRGAVLSHVNVVRSFEAKKMDSETKFELKIPAGLLANNYQLIVFAQEQDHLQITGASVYTPAY